LGANLDAIAEAGYNSLDKGVSRQVDDLLEMCATPLRGHFASPFAVHF
jgi:hypothetical protein